MIALNGSGWRFVADPTSQIMHTDGICIRTRTTRILLAGTYIEIWKLEHFKDATPEACQILGAFRKFSKNPLQDLHSALAQKSTVALYQLAMENWASSRDLDAGQWLWAIDRQTLLHASGREVVLPPSVSNAAAEALSHAAVMSIAGHFQVVSMGHEMLYLTVPESGHARMAWRAEIEARVAGVTLPNFPGT